MAQAVMPLIAQTFVESRSNTTFDMIATSNNDNNNASPLQRVQRRQLVNTPSPSSVEKGRKRSRGNKKESPKGKAKDDEVYYWSDEKLTETFRFVREVGYGNWGSLWLSRLYADRQVSVALKLVHRSRDPASSARVRALWNEYKCMRALRSTAHPNLINFHAFILTPSYSLVAMDYHPQLIQVAIPESRAKMYAQQLFSAVEHLHIHGISHNDIKPSNILLSSDDRPILIDFGFAQQWDTRSPDRFLSSLSWGTPEYLSPERANGHLHDERLSDIWALGITLYEIVVGRTPFEESEEEDFLTKGQLELYHHRSLTGKFYGDYLISSELENLVRLMVDPNPHTRAQSCGKALRHRFFNPISPSRSNQKTASMPSTPQSTTSSVTKSPIATSSAKRTPRQTPKKKEASFVIFEDETVPSPARTADPISPFSPRSGPLSNRTNQSPILVDSSPIRKRVISGPLVDSSPIRKRVISGPIKKTPPPSRIPVRKQEIASPPIKSPLSGRSTVKHFVANTTVPVPPLPSIPRGENVEQVKSKPKVTISNEKTPSPPSRTSSLHNRSASASSVKRKPVPAIFDASFELSNVSLSSITQSPKQNLLDKSNGSINREEVLSSNRTSPIKFDDPRLVKENSPSLSKTSAFLKRSFSRKPSRSSNLDTSLTGEFAFPTLSSPSTQQKTTAAVTERIRKMSAPLRNVPRPSISTMAGMKRSIFTITRRRTSSSASSFSFIDAEKLQEPRSITLPARVPAPANVDVEAQKARLSAFSAHIQHILETRKSLERDVQEVDVGDESNVQKVSKGSSKVAPFSFNGTAALESVDETSQLATPPSDVKRARASPKPSPALSHESSSSPSISGYRPGHRRIPTAIRNVPSVVLHESADEESFASETENANDESASERVASPPPPPRVVEPSRQLPTWVPNDEDSDEDEDNLADLDEPTITIGMTPRNRKPSKVCTIGKKSPVKASNATTRLSQSSPISTSVVSLEDQRVARPANPRKDTSTSRTSTPTPDDLPFRNLHHRSDSRASTTQTSNHLGHFRSRSVISFFTRSVSRASETSSLGWSTSSEVPIDGTPAKVKKGGKLRRAVSKIFR